MFFKLTYMYLFGFIKVELEGFFVERFLNLARNEGIMIQSLEKSTSTYIRFEMLRTDFRKIKRIAKKTKCRIKIKRKFGLPFLINKYKKRKVFAIACGVIAFFIIICSNIIWNIDIEGIQNIDEKEFVEYIAGKGIKEKRFKFNINTKVIENKIKIERDDIAWIGINIEGTSVYITIKEKETVPEINDKNEESNIIAKESGIITKLIVRSGTPMVKVGDEVKAGDILVQGIMNGQYKGERNVPADADIFGVIFLEKEKSEKFMQTEKIKTGEIEYENCVNFKKNKINFNKRVSKFQNYDTIRSINKIKLFSNFYLPIEIEKVRYEEYVLQEKCYSEKELEEKILRELEEELEITYNIMKYDNKNKRRDVVVNNTPDGLSVKLTYEIQIEIGTKVAK